MSPVEEVRTDLALEAQQLAVRRGADVPGVHVSERDLGFGVVTKLSIESDIGAQVMGKSKGTYVTIHVPDFQARRRELESDVSQSLASVVEEYLSDLGVPPAAPVLVVGLGNWNSTPDNLGPATVSKILVTRHLHEYRVLTEELLGRMRPVAALAPGVLGLTGVETAEIILGVVQKIQPALVICVDALASMSIERLGSTIQISDAGINPGSGVGNKRMALTRETLGVPVMAIGVPTVIHATTIVTDALDAMEAQSQSAFGAAKEAPPGGSMLDPAKISVYDPGKGATAPQGSLAPGGSDSRSRGPLLAGPSSPGASWRRAVIQEVLGDSVGRLIVTPKDIDVMIESISDVLADGLNEALHPGISAEEAAQLR